MPIRSHFSQLLNKEVNELISKIEHDVARGSAQDSFDYRQQVGRVQGLEEALAIADGIDSKMSGE